MTQTPLIPGTTTFVVLGSSEQLINDRLAQHNINDGTDAVAPDVTVYKFWTLELFRLWLTATGPASSMPCAVVGSLAPGMYKEAENWFDTISDLSHIMAMTMNPEEVAIRRDQIVNERVKQS